ncbi:MAG: universal stress protein, partial [Microscillaceae bacterium]|nr:universal stress protein [Microscillaceae bacterium]
QKVVFAYDFIQTQALNDFTGLVHFCQELGAKLHLLYVNTPDNFKDTAQVLNQMDTFLEAHGLFGKIEKHIYNDHTIEDGITAFAHIYQMDLIALTTHGYGGFRRFLHHSITENLVNFSDKNLLCLHF